MRILALESSAGPVSVAIVRDGELISYDFRNDGLTHSATLLPMVDSVLSAASLSLKDIDAIAVAVGPGSFTGLRIGVSTAKGLAWGRDIPCLAVSTLQAMARQAVSVKGILIPVMDARRDQFYNAIFRSDGKNLLRLAPDRAISAEELGRELESYRDEKRYFLGDGMKKCSGLLGAEYGGNIEEPFAWQSAAGVALEGHRLALEGRFVTAGELKPEYIRMSQAERERLEKLKK